MSISTSGCASRSFIIGIRLCPPARIRASGPYLASSASACSTLAAFSYSTCAGTCTSRLLPRHTGQIPGNRSQEWLRRSPMGHTGHCYDAHSAERVRAGRPAWLGHRRSQRPRRQRARGIAGADRAAPAPRRPADHPRPGRHDADSGRLPAAGHGVPDRRARRGGSRRGPGRPGRARAAAGRRHLDVRRVRGRPADGGVHRRIRRVGRGVRGGCGVRRAWPCWWPTGSRTWRSARLLAGEDPAWRSSASRSSSTGWWR